MSAIQMRQVSDHTDDKAVWWMYERHAVSCPKCGYIHMREAGAFPIRSTFKFDCDGCNKSSEIVLMPNQ